MWVRCIKNILPLNKQTNKQDGSVVLSMQNIVPADVFYFVLSRRHLKYTTTFRHLGFGMLMWQEDMFGYMSTCFEVSQSLSPNQPLKIDHSDRWNAHAATFPKCLLNTRHCASVSRL